MIRGEEIQAFYDFSEFRLDAINNLLYYGEDVVSLTPKEYEVLFLLVINPGRVIGKEELLDAVWHDTFIEEGTLTRNISWLRKKLGARSNEKFIETIPKRGYRFLPEVTKTSAAKSLVAEKTGQALEAAEDKSKTAEEIAPNKQKNVPGTRSKKLLKPNKTLPFALLITAFIILILVTLTVYKNYFYQPKTLLINKSAPFSGLPGFEDMPNFSPDGKQMVFAWNGDKDRGKLNIYIKSIGNSDPVRLTNSQENDDINPVVSPDRRFIAFVRQFATNSELIMISSLGGAERKICELNFTTPTLSFSPDGRSLIIDEVDAATKSFDLYSVNIETGEKQRLADIEDSGDRLNPHLSPDGTQIAFLKVVGNKALEIYVVSATGGTPRQITFDKSYIDSLAWRTDGKNILFISHRKNNQPNLWQISIAGGEPELISTGGKNIKNLAADPDGKTVAFVETAEDVNIWQITPNHGMEKFIASAQNDHSPQFSPDGLHVAFVSNRTGNNEIWIADAKGKNQRQLTESHSSGSPQFSPDGKLIAFDLQTDINADVFVVSAGGGKPNRLTDGKFRNSLPAWSPDGQTIYFRSNRGGENQLYKMPADGSAEPVQVTQNGVFQAAVAADGKTIFYSKGAGINGLWSIRTDGTGEAPVPELADAGYWRSWMLGSRGIYYVARNAAAAEAPYQIKFYDFLTRQIRNVTTVDKPPLGYYSGLSVSADEKQILYAQSDRQISSIWLAELP